MKKNGQAWGFDLMLASVLFIGGLVIFYVYSLNSPSEGREKLDDLFYEGSLIADNLLSEGLPSEWNETDVIRIGLLSEGKINQTKLEWFNNITIKDDQRAKNLLTTKYEFIFNISESIEFEGGVIGGIKTQEPVDIRNLIKITRFTIYKNKPVTMTIQVWEEE